ncbi:MAG: hypothetical protein EOO90_06765 [Pedobacter sp.]|nr:MAG: hypothetical protein EOO90_06765 [Pedobacter sp.]
MQIIDAQKVDMSKFGISTSCGVYFIHLKVLDINSRAKEIIDMLTDKSWIHKLGVVDRKSYEARAEQTIKKIVEDILMKVDSKVTEDFGEYLVSDSAGNALRDLHKHMKVVLAELWKEQKTGNPGFDFHTEGPNEMILFGEAKFKTSGSPYTIALEQIVDFVGLKKDEMELADLQRLVSPNAVTNAVANIKGYIAAFSLNAINHMSIFEKALKSDAAQKLLCHKELYLIGVEV